MVRTAVGVARQISEDSALVRNISNGVQALIFALLLWTVNTVQGLKEASILAAERDIQKTAQISELRAEILAMKTQMTLAATAAASAASAAASVVAVAAAEAAFKRANK